MIESPKFANYNDVNKCSNQNQKKIISIVPNIMNLIPHYNWKIINEKKKGSTKKAINFSNNLSNKNEYNSSIFPNSDSITFENLCNSNNLFKMPMFNNKESNPKNMFEFNNKK